MYSALEDECLKRIQFAKESGSQILDLSFMSLADIPETILELDSLVELDLSNNSFTRLPNIINELTSLKYLYLRNNCFTYSNGIGFDVINSLQIEFIDLSLNNLSQIPDDVFYLRYLLDVNLKGNPLIHGIPESIIEQGYETIYQFIEELYYSKTSDKLLEAKLVFVGQGEVGKTSLMKKMLEPRYEFKEGYEPTTHGINVRKWNKEVYFSDGELESILNENIDYEEDEMGNSEQYYSDSILDYETEEDYYSDIELKFLNRDIDTSDEYYNPLMDLPQSANHKNTDNTKVKYRNIKEAQFNIWDFGGQEIYYSTHQFF